jgi:hypothetical protein
LVSAWGEVYVERGAPILVGDWAAWAGAVGLVLLAG